VAGGEGGLVGEKNRERKTTVYRLGNREEGLIRTKGCWGSKGAGEVDEAGENLEGRREVL